jgi:aspartate aminotransferase
VTYYLIEKAGVGLVPFLAFGCGADNDWFRVSVGTTKMADVPAVIDGLRRAMEGLKG